MRNEDQGDSTGGVINKREHPRNLDARMADYFWDTSRIRRELAIQRRREQESRPVRESDLVEEPEPIRINADEDQESVFEA